MCIYKAFNKVDIKTRLTRVTLIFSIWFYDAGGRNWFCRIWGSGQKNRFKYGQSYGKNKFEAYRKAQNDLLSKIDKV